MKLRRGITIDSGAGNSVMPRRMVTNKSTIRSEAPAERSRRGAAGGVRGLRAAPSLRLRAGPASVAGWRLGPASVVSWRFRGVRGFRGRAFLTLARLHRHPGGAAQRSGGFALLHENFSEASWWCMRISWRWTKRGLPGLRRPGAARESPGGARVFSRGLLAVSWRLRGFEESEALREDSEDSEDAAALQEDSEATAGALRGLRRLRGALRSPRRCRSAPRRLRSAPDEAVQEESACALAS